MEYKLRQIRRFHGIRVTPAVCILPEKHPCYKCVWYARNTNVLFCPLQNCVRKKSGSDENDN